MSSSGIVDTPSFPLIMTAAGPQPTPPAAINTGLITSITATDTDYTANLPGLLIEDISSTDTGAIVIIDAMRVETVMSLTPYGANAYLLNQMGAMLGIPIGTQTNTSVYVIFSGPAGFQIGKGFTVTDGTYQYVVQDPVTIGSGGVTPQVYCLATIQGSWAIPVDTVSALVTSVPSTISLSVTNTLAGTPGNVTGETLQSYQARVLQGELAASTGMPRLLRTALGQVANITPRLTSVLAQSGGGWMIMCGGGDPYAMAGAIFNAVFDVSTLVGSIISVTNISNAANGEVTTAISHGLIAGQNNVTIPGVTGMTLPSGPFTVASVVDDFHFTINVNTTSLGTWTSGGTVLPNARNVSVSINDYPNTYVIPLVIPLQQLVTMTITWNTDSPNFVSDAAIQQAVQPNIAAYINSIAAGLPMNTLMMNAIFQNSINGILDPNLLDELSYAVYIDGVQVNPISGSSLIQGDTQSYLYTTANDITVTQG